MKEDNKERCGYKWLSIWKKPEDDPYFEACKTHDQETSPDSYAAKYEKLSDVQDRFERAVERARRIRYSGLGAYRILGSFYKLVTRYLTWPFWEGKK